MKGLLGSVFSLGMMFVGQGAWVGIFKTLGLQILSNKLAGKQQGPRLSDLSINLDGEGLEKPRGWGRWGQDMRLVGSNGLKERTVESGGGFLGLEPTTVEYKYSSEAFHVGGRGPITRPRRIKLGYDTIAEYDSGTWKFATVAWKDVDGGNNENKEGYFEGSWSIKKKSTGKFRLYKGTRNQPVDPFWVATKGAGNWTNYPDEWCLYVYVANVARYGQTVPRPWLEMEYTVTDLPSIILEIGRWVNRKPEDFNLTALEGMSVVKHDGEGFVVDSRRPADEILGDLMDLYKFYLPEIDGVITAVKWPPDLSDAPVLTDKVFRVQAGYNSKNDVAPSPIIVAEGESLAEVSEIIFQDIGRDNQAGYRYARRWDAISRRKSSKGYSATLKGSHAGDIVRTALAEDYAQATGKDGTLGMEYFNVAPADAFWVEMPDGLRPMALSIKTTPFFGPIGTKNLGFDPLAFGLPELPDTEGLQRETPVEPGLPILFVAEYPLAVSGNYGATTPALVFGACAYPSEDFDDVGRVNYDKMANGEWKEFDEDPIKNESIIGELTSSYTPLPPTAGFVAEESFNCRLYGGNLSTILNNDDDVDNYLIFSNGLIVCYRECEKVAESEAGDIYKFSNLYAGPWGTDDFLETLSSGTRLLPLRHNGHALSGPEWAKMGNNPSKWIGQPIRVRLKGASLGVSKIFDPFHAENVRPPSPVIESATRGIDGSLMLHGRARTRFFQDSQNTTTSSYTFKEYRFVAGYKYQIELTSGGTTGTIEMYTANERGSYDFNITAAKIIEIFGEVPASLTGEIALVGQYGAGRKRPFAASL